MSSPNSSLKPQKRPGHSSRHSSSWINRLQRHHDRKHHSHEEEPLLAEEQPASDIEAQEEDQQQPEIQHPSPTPRPKAWFDMVAEASKRTSNAVCQNWRQLVVSGCLTLLAVLVTLLIAFYFRYSGGGKLSRPVCTSAACVHAASGILYNLDPAYAQLAGFKHPSVAVSAGYSKAVSKDLSKDACTDFNQLVCGGFDQHHDLRPDQSDMFTGTLMVEDSQTTLRHILEGDAGKIPTRDRPNFEKLKADYDACMDETTIRNLGLKPLNDVVDHVKSFFASPESAWKVSPIRSSHAQHGLSSSGTNTLTEALLYLTNLEIPGLVSTGIGADDKDPETQVIFVSSPQLGLPSKEYYEDKATLGDYQAMAVQVLDHFQQNPSRNSTVSTLHSRPLWHMSSGDLAKDVVSFETKMAALTPPEEDLNDITKTYNPMTLDQIAKILPQISFEYLITKLAPKGYSARQVIVGSPTYLKGLSQLLTETPSEILSAFLVWKTIQRYASRIEDPALTPLKRFSNVIQGKDPDAVAERWRTCITAVDRDLGWILSKFFVDNAFSPAAKQFGDQIVTDIKDSFVDILAKAQWMTEEVRNRSINKVYAIDQKIGYPTSNPDIMDPAALERYYKDITVSNTTHFNNGLQVAKFDIQEEWSKLAKPTRHDEWGMTVPTVNAYYNPAGNEIVFPAGIMQHPVFYNPSVPQYLSYGAFGSVSGHELSHAFDNTGSQYDESGRYSSWWDNETRAAFDDKTKCFVDEYAEFTVPGPEGSLHVNGKLTLGENVADAGGLHAAFSAWKRREEEKPSLGLPGLEFFTNEQLFFVNYANWWCGKSTTEAAIERIYTDPHAPKWARVLGTMANSAEFKKAFNCPTKEPTCELW